MLAKCVQLEKIRPKGSYVVNQSAAVSSWKLHTPTDTRKRTKLEKYELAFWC